MATQHSRKHRDAHESTGALTPEAILARAWGIPLAEVLEEYEERAAIREVLGGMPRHEAEHAARKDAGVVLRRRHGVLF